LTSVLKHCPRLETVVPTVVPSPFAVPDTWRLSSENAAISAVAVTSTITIETSIDEFVIVYKKSATKADETNDTKLNNKYNVQFIRTHILHVPDYLDIYFAVDHWFPLVLQHPGFDLSSSPDDVTQIGLATWGETEWTFKPFVVRN
jgi:hypothetical protein